MLRFVTTFFAAALLATHAYALSYVPVPAAAFYHPHLHAAYAGASGLQAAAHAVSADEAAFAGASSHLFHGICERRGFVEPGSNLFNAACLRAGFVVPSEARSERYCKKHGYAAATPAPAACSTTGACGCRHRWCWQGCGKQAVSAKNRGGDWCWSSYKTGADNWLRCREDDDCSVLVTTCGSKCG